MRALLAALLIEPGRVVSTERLVDELWGEAGGPPGARKLVSQYVFRLRRVTGDHERRVLVTEAPGYRIAAGRAEVDAGRFEELVAAGRQALRDDDAGRAAQLCTEALDLWRGPALADVPRGSLVAAEADRLEELRLAAVELRIEAALCCGSGAEFVIELQQLTSSYPLRERFWELLMRALEDCGRPAESLAAYARAREVIADELGADPGPSLRRQHQHLLASGPPPAAGPGNPLVSDPPPAAAAGQDRGLPPTDAAGPRHLPGAVPDFMGRAEELQRLSCLLDQAGADHAGAVGGAVVISAIGGTAGVGKTALAVHWAHQVAHRFPDGQLYVNLRGYDPGQPVPPADVLAAFLRALGLPGQDIPAELYERAAMYRSLLAGRRVLVLLDNAKDDEQVRPLLPSTRAALQW